MRKISFLLAVLVGIVCAEARVTPLEQAKKLFVDGQYDEALPQLEALVKKKPRDGNANYYLGATLYALERYDESVKPLTVARERGVADASRLLAVMAFDRYDVDEAQACIDDWEARLKKTKTPIPDELATLSARLVLMRNMLERVEQIAVIDSLTVDADDFFSYYRLSPEAGRLMSGSTPGLPAGVAMAYMPQNRSEIIWVEPDTAGTYRLMSAPILDDGTLEHALPLDDSLGEGGDACYPFMMTDGITLYYANNGENSLGGYDIFLTRRGDDGFLQPQNVGMPYNSPYDDYLLAIDENTGAGWWATDRNRIPGKVTIYVFVPSAVRTNYPTDSENIVEMAKLSSIAATQTGNAADYDALRKRIATVSTAGAGESVAATRFDLSLGGARVYHSLGDFKNPDARGAMEQLLEAQKQYDIDRERLSAMRRTYASGNKSVSDEILSLEESLGQRRAELIRLRNTVINLEKQL